MTIMLSDPKSHEFEKKKTDLTSSTYAEVSSQNLARSRRSETPLEGNTYVQLSQKLSDTDFRNHYL